MLPNPNFGNFESDWYSIFVSISIFAISLYLLLNQRWVSYQALSLKERYFSLVLLLVLGIIGSYFFFLLEFCLGKEFLNCIKNSFSLSVSGRWYGTVFIYTISFFIYSIFNNNNSGKIFDLMGLLILIAIIIGKIGCFLDGHYGCYGIPTSAPWGVTFPYGSGFTLIPVHPVQIYDSIFHFILFTLVNIYLRNKPSGIVGLFILLSTSIYNFFIEIIRTHDKVFGILTLAQVVYVFVFFFATLIFFFDKSKA